MNPLAWLYLGWFWLSVRIAYWQISSPTANLIACFR